MKKYSRKVFIILFSVILFAILLEGHIFTEVDKYDSYKVTNVLLNQIIELLNNNRRNSEDLYASVKEDYKVRAQSVSYILDSKPSAIYDVEELRKIANLLSIDEIHIFDEKGVIVSGSVPKYYGISMDSGDQIGYFKPMLSDKSLSMCQDITPNTAESKQMMYAITWNEKGTRIVQIGIEPDRLIKAMERNEIANVLEELPVTTGVTFFVADVKNGQIRASNFEDKSPATLKDIGFYEDLSKLSSKHDDVLAINGKTNYCSYKIDGDYLVCVGESTRANNTIFIVTLLVIFCYLFLAGCIISQIIISKSKAEAEKLEQFEILSAVSKIYYSMHIIDLEANTVEVYSEDSDVEQIRKSCKNPPEMMKTIMQQGVAEEYREQILEFTDLTTLKERMTGKKVLTAEFVSVTKRWFRANFITVQKNKSRQPVKVAFAVRDISDEKNKESILIHRSTTDELTNLYNRHAFEDDLKELDFTKNFCYISFDLNGLKNANDTIGHNAGDELIKASARLMKDCFKKAGKIYRTGGDEFAAILTKNLEEIPEILVEFKQRVAAWSGEYIKFMSVSCGLVTGEEKKWANIRDILQTADKRMYAEKEAYYQQTGMDRRAYQKTYTALGPLYTKILKINLTKDNYKIVKVDKDEQTNEKGFENSISLWLKQFALSGQVHQDSVKNYLEKTDIKYLRSYFKEGSRVFSLAYKRKIGEEFRQVLMEIIPADDYSEENQSCFLYVKDISSSQK